MKVFESVLTDEFLSSFMLMLESELTLEAFHNRGHYDFTYLLQLHGLKSALLKGKKISYHASHSQTGDDPERDNYFFGQPISTLALFIPTRKYKSHGGQTIPIFFHFPQPSRIMRLRILSALCLSVFCCWFLIG